MLIYKEKIKDGEIFMASFGSYNLESDAIFDAKEYIDKVLLTNKQTENYENFFEKYSRKVLKEEVHYDDNEIDEWLRNIITEQFKKHDFTVINLQIRFDALKITVDFRGEFRYKDGNVFTYLEYDPSGKMKVYDNKGNEIDDSFNETGVYDWDEFYKMNYKMDEYITQRFDEYINNYEATHTEW